MATEEYETHEHDVLVIGAGGAGLRAAIEAAAQGMSVGLVCKSLLGKAHTVMAEGGIAAAMGNVWPEDNWQVHFRDTMRGGKMLNNWRMAQLHAQESPERVLELERYGALFDRTKEGLISQRDFGGHRYARLAHVGDRTGLEMIRTLQYHAIHQPIEVYMECKIERLIKDGDRVAGAFGYWRNTGKFVLFKAKAVVLATGGIGKAWKFTSNSWEYTGDGHSLAVWAGADLIDMEFVQFHPTGMVWPPSVRGILVTEGVRGDGGTLKNTNGERFMFNYIPEFFKGETADSQEEADRWYVDKKNNRRTPDLLPRDEVARAINSEVKAGRGTPHGGVFLDICTRRDADYIRKRLPSMYHQFKELAGVDITKEPMEVGPTCHYVMGGVRVDADSTAATVPGLFAAGEVAGGMHGSNRLGGNSLGDLLVFGRRAGLHAALYAKNLGGALKVDAGQVEQIARQMLEPFTRTGGENPYTIQSDLQETMQNLVGIIRVEAELKEALQKLEALKERAKRVRVEGGRVYNPGWHTALDLAALLTVSECCALAALERKESRGGHTREDHPYTDDTWGTVNLVSRQKGDRMELRREPLPQMPPELRRPSSRRRSDADLHDAGVPRQPRGGRLQGVQGRGRRGPGGARRDPPDPGHPGPGPRLPLELQGGQVRLVQRGGQRPAAAHVHDPDGPVQGRGADLGGPHPDLPADPGPGHRRLLQLREGQAGPAAAAQAAGRGRQVPDDAGGRRARAGVPQVHRVLPVPGRLPRDPRPRGEEEESSRARASSSRPPRSRCTRSTRWTAPGSCATTRASGSATSPSAAPRSARSTSTSPTTASSR